MPRELIQLTDCHLFADPHRSLRDIVTWPRFMATLQVVRQRVPNADLLVLSGDTAHDETRATYESVFRELTDWTERCRILPGNHDDRDAIRGVFSPANDGPPGRITFHVAWPDWQVIGLDSQQPGELAGQLGSDQLDWLHGRLELSAVPAVLFLHHPPLDVQSAWLDRIGLRDATDFGRLLERHPQVRLVVCGHVHQQLAASLAHATVLTTPAVGPQFRPRTEQLEIDVAAPPAYRLLELHPEGRWSTQVLSLP